MIKSRTVRYEFRKLRVRGKVSGHAERPRLAVYRSLKHIYAQVIDDVAGRTLVAASSKEKDVKGATGVKAAALVGKLVAQRATEKGISAVVFDRAGRPYHGQVKAVAEGARESGLKF